MIQLPERIWSSWRCVQALTVTLAILFLPVPASALEPGIDLLEALNLHTNHSRYAGVSLTQGNTMKMGYHLSTEDKIKRNLVLPVAAYRRAADAIRRSSDFTFAATLRQEENNVASIISFSHSNNRYLELQSSGQKSEIRFHFTAVASDGTRTVHAEILSYKLADNKWHKVALSVSGTEIQLLIDCTPLYRRETHYLPDRNFSASNMQLFVGQQDGSGMYPFKGDIEEAHIIPGPNGHLKQCPHSDFECPTCGQFSLLQDTVFQLQLHLQNLTKRLEAAESRVLTLEACDCHKSCNASGVIREDREQWNVGCETCRCDHGTVVCAHVDCGVKKCKFPVRVRDECCPICLRNCLLDGVTYDHAESTISGCANCSCGDGNMNCVKLECANLTCPVKQQVNTTGSCCPICPGDDYCAKGNACHTNADCNNLPTKYLCTCKTGFKGDGLTTCSDVNECTHQGGTDGNHCIAKTTKCVNTVGSYVCECLPGFRRHDHFNCVEVDECATGLHTCHEHAECRNTRGSYQCSCRKGYAGNGTHCTPVCEQSCLNGGLCLSPGICTCRNGYKGAACEQDLDECLTGLHTCNASAYCVNMPGWYYCKCKPGYETRDGGCFDIDECHHNTHSCHESAECVNTDGHFECRCADNDPTCSLSCMFERAEIQDGDLVNPGNQPCKFCKCSKGVISCEDQPCNCSTWRGGSGRDICCPQCDPKESCQHQELNHVVFKSGEQWIYQCQTCECLFGEFDCWKMDCPKLTCDKPLPLAPGDCCPRCPNDPCSIATGNVSSTVVATTGRPCTYQGQIYESGQTFSDPSSQCTTCGCKDGRLCCSFDNNCNDNKPRRLQSFHPAGHAYLSHGHTTSKTATAAAQMLRTQATPLATAPSPSSSKSPYLRRQQRHSVAGIAIGRRRSFAAATTARSTALVTRNVGG